MNRMIEEAAHDPETGIGKPERLSHNLSGYWSRRSSGEPSLEERVRRLENLVQRSAGSAS
ncbi:MAG TPA: type II toxin-antitoxin system YoeB family toxin [Pseudonocardiaceae bacterium]|nr:type II toxin-antitoxin system YoeB family toxin [Pseudonocardiaceae bacterium]